jgi:exonuclease V gamma subunit
VSITPKVIQDLLDELEASRASRKRAWELLQELRWVLKDVTGVEAPHPERKTIDLEGRIIKEAIRKALRERQSAIAELIRAIKEYRKLADQPLTLRDSVYAEAVQNLKKAIEKADRLLEP